MASKDETIMTILRDLFNSNSNRTIKRKIQELKKLDPEIVTQHLRRYIEEGNTVRPDPAIAIIDPDRGLYTHIYAPFLLIYLITIASNKKDDIVQLSYKKMEQGIRKEVLSHGISDPDERIRSWSIAQLVSLEEDALEEVIIRTFTTSRSNEVRVGIMGLFPELESEKMIPLLIEAVMETDDHRLLTEGLARLVDLVKDSELGEFDDDLNVLTGRLNDLLEVMDEEIMIDLLDLIGVVGDDRSLSLLQREEVLHGYGPDVIEAIGGIGGDAAFDILSMMILDMDEVGLIGPASKMIREIDPERAEGLFLSILTKKDVSIEMLSMAVDLIRGADIEKTIKLLEGLTGPAVDEGLQSRAILRSLDLYTVRHRGRIEGWTGHDDPTIRFHAYRAMFSLYPKDKVSMKRSFTDTHGPIRRLGVDMFMRSLEKGVIQTRDWGPITAVIEHELSDGGDSDNAVNLLDWMLALDRPIPDVIEGGYGFLGNHQEERVHTWCFDHVLANGSIEAIQSVIISPYFSDVSIPDAEIDAFLEQRLPEEVSQVISLIHAVEGPLLERLLTLIHEQYPDIIPTTYEAILDTDVSHKRVIYSTILDLMDPATVAFREVIEYGLLSDDGRLRMKAKDHLGDLDQTTLANVLGTALKCGNTEIQRTSISALDKLGSIPDECVDPLFDITMIGEYKHPSRAFKVLHRYRPDVLIDRMGTLKDHGSTNMRKDILKFLLDGRSGIQNLPYIALFANDDAEEIQSDAQREVKRLSQTEIDNDVLIQTSAAFPSFLDHLVDRGLTNINSGLVAQLLDKEHHGLVSDHILPHPTVVQSMDPETLYRCIDLAFDSNAVDPRIYLESEDDATFQRVFSAIAEIGQERVLQHLPEILAGIQPERIEYCLQHLPLSYQGDPEDIHQVYEELASQAPPDISSIVKPILFELKKDPTIERIFQNIGSRDPSVMRETLHLINEQLEMDTSRLDSTDEAIIKYVKEGFLEHDEMIARRAMDVLRKHYPAEYPELIHERFIKSGARLKIDLIEHLMIDDIGNVRGDPPEYLLDDDVFINEYATHLVNDLADRFGPERMRSCMEGDMDFIEEGFDSKNGWVRETAMEVLLDMPGLKRSSLSLFEGHETEVLGSGLADRFVDTIVDHHAANMVHRVFELGDAESVRMLALRILDEQNSFSEDLLDMIGGIEDDAVREAHVDHLYRNGRINRKGMVLKYLDRLLPAIESDGSDVKVERFRSILSDYHFTDIRKFSRLLMDGMEGVDRGWAVRVFELIDLSEKERDDLVDHLKEIILAHHGSEQGKVRSGSDQSNIRIMGLNLLFQQVPARAAAYAIEIIDHSDDLVRSRLLELLIPMIDDIPSTRNVITLLRDEVEDIASKAHDALARLDPESLTMLLIEDVTTNASLNDHFRSLFDTVGLSGSEDGLIKLLEVEDDELNSLAIGYLPGTLDTALEDALITVYGRASKGLKRRLTKELKRFGILERAKDDRFDQLFQEYNPVQQGFTLKKVLSEKIILLENLRTGNLAYEHLCEEELSVLDDIDEDLPAEIQRGIGIDLDEEIRSMVRGLIQERDSIDGAPSLDLMTRIADSADRRFIPILLEHIFIDDPRIQSVVSKGIINFGIE